MLLSDISTQMPAADDIDGDSLEYLFGRRKMPTPWVKMAKEPEPIARISPEMVRLQAKAETIAAQLDSVLNQLQRAHVELGFTKAQLTDKTEKLKLFAEYRAKAAWVVAAETERVVLNERISDLELQLLESLEQNRVLADSVAAYKAARVMEAVALTVGVVAQPTQLPVAPPKVELEQPAPTVLPPVAPTATKSAGVSPANPPTNPPVTELADAIMRHVQPDTFIVSVGLEAIIFALMICFASLVILHILM